MNDSDIIATLEQLPDEQRDRVLALCRQRWPEKRWPDSAPFPNPHAWLQQPPPRSSIYPQGPSLRPYPVTLFAAGW